MTLSATDAKAIEEKWDTIRKNVQIRWPQLDQSDLQMIDGDSRKLIALVHQKTGAGLSEIEDAIDEIAASSNGLLNRVSRTVAETANAASSQIKRAAAQTFESVEDTVASSPQKSLPIAFAAAAAVGFLLTCCIRPSERNN